MNIFLQTVKVKTSNDEGSFKLMNIGKNILYYILYNELQKTFSSKTKIKFSTYL